ncbi:MAG: septal ring lytic transglycosylase RlpA family protein [Labilithrix sp.]|nr:septal ring lytic transglycosylase RlpA family protein [Labilithrix sp.]MBX3220289.1 septal ring lytic transglycosylase RlpA family protein [Labilithrix sp.]
MYSRTWAAGGLLLFLSVAAACGDGDDAGTDGIGGGGSTEDAGSRPVAPEGDGDDPDDGAGPTGDAGADSGAPDDDGDPIVGEIKSCKASYYQSGSKTANGESFNPNGMTAAHRTLPFNTMLRVKNTANGKSVDVRINDRGPFGSSTRCLDLARGAFAAISPLSAGVITVEYGTLKN